MNTKHRTTGPALLLAVALGAAFAPGPAPADHVPLVNLPQGSGYTENFDDGDGGWVATAWASQQTTWEWGAPTFGPAVEEGDRLWATNLSGNHLVTECGWIESPAIEIPLLAPNGMPVTRAVLRWDQWYRSFGSPPVTANGGVVQVGRNGVYTNVVPAGGYPATPMVDLDYCLEHISQGSGAFGGALDASGDPLAGREASISEHAGETITIRFVFAARPPTPFGGSGAGWYVDNVRIDLSTYLGTPHLPVQ